MEPITLILLIALPTLLVGSALFSGSETALFSLTAHQRARLSASDRPGAHAASTLLVETRALLVTLLVGNMVINVLYFTLSTLLIDRWLASETIGAGGAAGLALCTLLGVIMFGEVLPKQVAAQRAFSWASWVGVPLLGVHRLIAPVRLIAQHAVITPLARMIAPPTKPPELSTDELDTMLSMSRQRGIIDRDEQHLLQHVLELGQLKVKDVMVPRVDIHGHNLADPPEQLLELAKETRLRFLPVYDKSLDSVKGIASTREVLLRPPTSESALMRLLRPAYFVPEVAAADELLTNLRDKGLTLAMVVDEYGGTAGLVTIEDVVEHFLGEIPGAYEQDGQAPVEQLDPGIYRVGADLAVHDWAEWFGRNPAISKAASDATTLGGVVLGLLGRAPEEGDRVAIGNMVITVEHVEGRRIMSVVVALADAEPAGTDAGSSEDQP